MRRPPPTLRAKAVAWLAQRDHSELELRRKLARWMSQEAAKARHAAEAAGGVSAGSPNGDVSRSDRSPSDMPPPDEALPDEARLDEVLGWLKEKGYLDDARFVQQRVVARQGRLGTARIRQELAQLGLGLSADDAAALRESEFERARALWQRRYGGPAADARDTARQARFLTGRGFSADVVRRVLRQAGAAADDAG